MRTNRPVSKARIAGRAAGKGTGTEPAVVDHGAVVADLGVSTIDRAREVAGPEVFEPGTRRPGRGLFDGRAVDVRRVGDGAQRNLVAAAIEAGARQVRGDIPRGADAVGEVTTDPAARAQHIKFDL